MYIEMIIQALEDKFQGFEGDEEVKADIILWLYNQISDEKSKSKIEEWFEKNNRCIRCGKKLFTTYKRNLNTIPPKKELYSFCSNCDM